MQRDESYRREVKMEDLAVYGIDYARKQGAAYADIRAEEHYNEIIIMMSGKVDKAMANRKRGIGVRVIANGAWGFRSTTNLTKDGVKEAVNVAMKAAKASGEHIVKPVELAPTKAHRVKYEIPVKLDIEDCSFGEKIEELSRWEREIKVNEKIKRTRLSYCGIKVNKLFLNSEGAEIGFKNSLIWVISRADAEVNGLTQFYDKCDGGTGGYELVREKDMSEFARETGEKAISLLEAKPAKDVRNAKVILDREYVSLLSHEIVGHPSEADRVLGREAAWAGTAWWAGKIGEKIGSELFTVYDDPTVPGTLGYYLYDDEGVKAERKVLIEKGVLKTHMHSRETAAFFGVEPNAGMRAITYEYIPLIRMSNTFVAPSDWKFDEMIQDTREGFLICGHREPSIDDKRYNWTISAHEAYEIRNGELSTHLRDVSLMSTAPKFFMSVDAVSKEWEVRPMPGCGKGDPLQALYVGNGGACVRGVADVIARR